MIRRLSLLFLLAALLVPSLLLSGCASDEHNGADANLKMAPLSEMPAEVRQASVTTQQAYQFALANPDITKAIPCYCGCGAMGHASNYACYVKSDEGGKVLYDQHALGCGICVDITLDAMRMTAKGKPIDEIKTYIDDTYSRFGPTNMED